MIKKNLVWLDLEMTGLDPEKDQILEMATLVTNNNLEVIGVGPHFIIHHAEDVLQSMDEWNRTQHTKSGLWAQVLVSTTTLHEAEEQTLAFLMQYCKPKDAPLCGNSVFQDKAFLKKYMKNLEQFFHYRIIDVSSIKELVRRWYQNNAYAYFKKSEDHRAVEDIYSSIAELNHYRTHFFIAQDLV